MSKKNTSPWFRCDKCATNLLNKDIESHFGDCPPNFQVFKYGFIRDETLYGNLDIKTNEDIKNITQVDKNFLVFLSQSAIQLTNLAIGEWCELRTNNQSIAMMVWPTTEKTLTSILLTKNTLELNFPDTKTITVSKLNTDIKPALQITMVTLNSPKNLEMTTELNNRISKSFKGKYFTVGNKISVLFYGKTLKFEIKSITGGNNLEDKMGDLELDNKFFVADDGTKWLLYKTEMDFQRQNNKPQLIKKIAGLNEEIEEIRHSIKACFANSQSRAILLYGNSGTGKTLLANAMAQESQAFVVKISAPDLYSKYTGDLEGVIKGLFEEAIDGAPSVVIVDDIDILCPCRSGRITDGEKRIVSTFLTMFDCLGGLNVKVFVLATTSKLEVVDPSFRRTEMDFQRQNNKPPLIEKIAGLTEEIDEIRHSIKACFANSQSGAILLYGNSGTGKSLLANAMAQESQAFVVKISAPDLYSKYTGDLEGVIKGLFEEAIDGAPSVVVVDDIDILCPSRSGRITDGEKRIVSTFLTMFDYLGGLNVKVFVLATTSKLEVIDPSFRKFGRLDRELEVPTPNPDTRCLIIQKILEDYQHGLSTEEIKDLGFKTHGFVGADLVSLCSRANLNASKRPNCQIQTQDIKFALTKVRPSAMREVQIEIPNIKWSDIGGQNNLKLILKQAVEWPLKHANCFTRLGISPPKGVLMYGPPGCSKTMIAKALATESQLNFLSIKGPELFSKWVGESERAVREVFRKARQVAPSIIFFDEIDALGGERSSGSSTSVQERVLAQLLTELDGVTPLGDVTVLAATNRPDRIDKALLRPGRLDRIVYVPLPDENTRREIFRIKLQKMPVSEISIEDLVQSTKNYSGAEVNAICHEAAMMALEEDLNIQTISKRHFEKALTLIKPRTPKTMIELYEDYAKIKV